MADIENKLDQDFLFYLSFVNTYKNRLRDPSDVQKCNIWLQKLIGGTYDGTHKKRSRNIFLSNLVLCMEESRLAPPFTLPITDIDMDDPTKYFPDIARGVESPDWLDDVANQGQLGGVEDPGEDREGRTYVATRTMPGGNGAFAYVAISLAGNEPRWLGGGEGALDEKLGSKYQKVMSDLNQMELILANRRDPKDRERVLTFYDVLLQNISDELDQVVPMEDNDAVNVLVQQLTEDLMSKGQFGKYDTLPIKEKRIELLLILHDRAKKRRDKAAKREELLDNIEAMMVPDKSFFDDSVQEQDRYEMPAYMWEQVINKPPAKKFMEDLDYLYPNAVVQKFVGLLSDEKEQIARRMQRRHENIVSQMKKELRKEGEKYRTDLSRAKRTCDQAVSILKNVLAARQKQIDSENNAPKRKKGGETSATAMYEEMRNALMDTQMSVEDEAERGQMLSQQINDLNEQHEAYHQVTEETIRKSEEANMAIMKNIKKLKNGMKQHENRLAQIQLMTKQKKETKTDAFFVF